MHFDFLCAVHSAVSSIPSSSVTVSSSLFVAVGVHTGVHTYWGPGVGHTVLVNAATGAT